MTRTTQEAFDQSTPTSALVLKRDAIEKDADQYPSLLRQMDVNPAALRRIQEQIGQQAQQDAFIVVDLSSVKERFKLWTKLLPQIEPFYAVKCNPDARILQLLADLGCCFDCASRTEIDDVLRHGVAPSNIIYANPCKQASHIAFAASNAVHMMTFDSTEELDKIKQVAPDAQLVLRLYVDDTNSVMRLGAKFGALFADAGTLFAHAKTLGLDVIGVSFHVGSGCFSGSAYSDAVQSARKVFDIGASMGFQFTLLDVGGGFPSIDGDPISFEACAKELESSLREHFPADLSNLNKVRIIAEPGRFFVAPSHTLAVNVIGRKVASEPPQQQEREDGSTPEVPRFMYFVNDGLYGSFNGLVYDHPTIQLVVVISDDQVDDGDGLHPASMWGPTCDGMD